MPRYFFDVYDGFSAPDAVGCECADWSEAQQVATRYAGELLQKTPDRLWGDEDWTIQVRDAHGLDLFTIVVVGLVSPAGKIFGRGEL